METTTEFEPNKYLVFAPDQVLMDKHLNQLFNYLDQQDRWTRNKLIGIGIACGLHLSQRPGIIEVSEGCGISSQGYLLTLPETKQYTYYQPYAGIEQPDFPTFSNIGNLPFYKSFIGSKNVFSLLTDKDFANLEPDARKKAQTISSANAGNMLADYAVVLFAEADEQSLKNCDTFDCNNAGDKMIFTLRALLVQKSDLPAVKRGLPVITTSGGLVLRDIPSTLTETDTDVKTPRRLSASGSGTSSASAETIIASRNLPDILIKRPFPVNIFPTRPPEINLKRFNVPYADLKTTDDVINAFSALVDDNTLASISSAFNYCYVKYKDVLDDAATGFPTLLNDLKAQRDLILQKNPVFIQYFYDFIDDLVKAYYEFRSKVSLLLSACCPDENLFPLHLILGEATANTKDFTRDSYRTYFMYSPLFAKQENAISETQFLYRRMQILVSEFTMITPDDIATAPVKILPSLYQKAPLSQRAIPYYYAISEEGKELYKYWDYSKTIRNDETLNISYTAGSYSSSLAVLYPLLYDIEKNDFFRIEGHIGTNFQAALTSILAEKKNYNLPFDVVAVSADQLSNPGGTLPQCNVQDLDTDFKLMVSGFVCKVHIPFCFITKMTNPPTTVPGNTGIGGGIFTGGIFTGGIFNRTVAADTRFLADDAIASDNISRVSFNAFKLKDGITDKVVIDPSVFRLGYRKGDFMRKYCPPAANAVTIGSVYLASIKNGVFTNPVPLRIQNNTNIYYYQLFQYVDAVESLMQVLMPATLTTLDMNAFSAAYQNFADSLYQVTVAAAEINNDKSETADAAAQQFLKDIETDMLVNELSVPVYDCLDERLQAVISEYADRFQQYQNSLNFLSYYSKHPGLEHKGGVPKGGTFVLVYRPSAPVESTTGTTTGTGIGGVKPTLPQTGGITGGIRNTGIINSGILKTGILKTSEIRNPVITGARLFMAKAPKKTPVKAAKKAKAKSVKKSSKDEAKPKDTPLRSGTILGGTRAGGIPVIKTASTPTRVAQPTTTTTQPNVTIPVSNRTEADLPVQPILTAQPVTIHPMIVTVHPDVSATATAATATGATIEPVNVATRPNPVAFDTDQPVGITTKPFKPVVITTRLGSLPIGSSSIPIMEKPTRIPIDIHFPVDTNFPVNQPANTSGLDQNTIDLIDKFANASADLSSENKKTILDFLKGAKQQLAPSKFNIAENVVIADFYVPYLCCSDCAPVAYIIQQPAPTPPQQEAPSFNITPKEFLFDDTATYPFTVKPAVTDANKAADPFASDAIINPGSLHLLTDANNKLFLNPAMPNLTVTTTATIAYQNIPVDITIIKPDASFTIDIVTDKEGNTALQVLPVDGNADTYKWTVNGVEGIFENTKSPVAVSIDDIRSKVDSSPFTIALTLSYKRNNKTSSDTKEQSYQPSVCIDFDAFELKTFFGARADQKEGDIAFTTTEKIEASVFQMTFPADKAFGSALIAKAPRNLGDGLCLQMDTIAMKFDYTRSNLKPQQVTVEFLVVGGIINLAVNGSDVYAGDISQLPKKFKDVKVGIDKADNGSARLVMKGEIGSFLIGGQQFFIDNVCAQ